MKNIGFLHNMLPLPYCVTGPQWIKRLSYSRGWKSKSKEILCEVYLCILSIMYVYIENCKNSIYSKWKYKVQKAIREVKIRIKHDNNDKTNWTTKLVACINILAYDKAIISSTPLTIQTYIFRIDLPKMDQYTWGCPKYGADNPWWSMKPQCKEM